MSSNDAKGMGAVWSGSALFAQTCLSENLGKKLGYPFYNGGDGILVNVPFKTFFKGGITSQDGLGVMYLGLTKMSHKNLLC